MRKKSKFHLTLVVLITMIVINMVTIHKNSAQAVEIHQKEVYNHIYNINKKKEILLKNNKIKDNSLNNRNVYIIDRSIKRASRSKLRYVPSQKEKIEIVMYSIKMVESHGRYNARSKWSSACGAYQYITLTWGNYKGFRNACLAPMWVQDRKMRGEMKYSWNKYHNWDQVIAAHMSPALASNPKNWSRSIGVNPTIKEYVNKVRKQMVEILSI